MANEATLLKQTSVPINFTVANTTGIEKGAILKMTDPNTAILNDSIGPVIAGIAAVEKIASDGVTKLAVHQEGDFKVYLSGACNVGQALVAYEDAVYDNYVQAASLASGTKGVGIYSGAAIIGYAKETGTNGQTIRMRLAIGG